MRLFPIAALMLAMGPMAWAEEIDPDCGCWADRSEISRATLKVAWQPEKRVSRPAPTGEEGAQQPRWTDRPLLVYVRDLKAPKPDFDTIEDLLLQDEQVCLAAKAFRTVKVDAADAKADPLLRDAGSSVPRMVLVDVKGRARGIEGDALKARAFYDLLTQAAATFWRDDLNAIVQKHRKLLTAQDKLIKRDKTLADKQSALSGDPSRKGDLAGVELERGGIALERKDIDKQEAALWKLTPKKS